VDEADKDRTFQAAMKAHRVLSVHQANVGNSADFGTVGFEAGLEGTLLVFPKSIRRFANRRVVGVKYDLLDAPKAVAKAKHPRTGKPGKPGAAKKAKVQPPAAEEPKSEPKSRKRHDEAKPPEELPKTKGTPTVGKLISGIKQAMKALNEGNAVRAYRTLAALVRQDL
jgi:hypothetical protein